MGQCHYIRVQVITRDDKDMDGKWTADYSHRLGHYKHCLVGIIQPISSESTYNQPISAETTGQLTALKLWHNNACPAQFL